MAPPPTGEKTSPGPISPTMQIFTAIGVR